MQLVPNRTNALPTTKGCSTRIKTGVAHGIRIFIEQKKFVHRVFYCWKIYSWIYSSCLAVQKTCHTKIYSESPTNLTCARAAINPVNSLISCIWVTPLAKYGLTCNIRKNRTRLSVKCYISVILCSVFSPFHYSITWPAPNPVLMPIAVRGTGKRQVVIILVLVIVDT